MTKKENNIVLLSVTLCWASAYIFIKDLPANLSTYAYVAITTGIAGIIMLIAFYKSLANLNVKTLLRGLILSVLITGTMIFEKMGLSYISSSTAGLVYSLNIVIVPFILIFFKKKPTRNNILGILIIIAGLLVSTGKTAGGNSIAGYIYMLASCSLMSFYTVISSEFTKKSDPLLLSVLQNCFSAIIGFVLWFAEDPATFSNITWTRQMLSSIFILAFFSKAYAYIMLLYAQKHSDAISVTVISATEPVITLALALLIPNSQGQTESFSVKALLGSLIIVIGAVVAGLNFLSPHKNIIEKTNSEEPNIASVTLENDKDLPLSKKERFIQAVKQFFLTMIPFAVLGAAFKVMVLVEGFTEVRPANAIPIVSGLLFGPIGALGCAVGNLIADCFGTLNMTSVLGVVGNFAAAYIPYRVWHIVSKETPNVRTWKNILLFVWVSALGALSCSTVLGFGLELFFGTWMEEIYKYVLLNNFGFSLVLGLPIFIVMTSNSIKTPIFIKNKTGNFLALPDKAIITVLIAETVLLLTIAGGVYFGYHLSNSIFIDVVAALAALLMLAVCILKRRED